MSEPRADSAPSARRFGPWRSEARAAFELFAIAGLAVAQPTCSLLGNNAGLFVSADAGLPEVLALLLVVLLVPPAVAYGIEALAGLVAPRSRRWAHAFLVGGFAGVLALEAVKRSTGLGPTVLVALAAAAGIVASLLVLRFETVRMFLRVVALAVPVFAVVLVVASPATPVLLSGGSGEAADVRVGDPRRVVFIVFDEMPTGSLLDGRGRVDAELFPNFAALAGTSTWFRNETTVAPYTQTAVPAILTGRFPQDPGALPTSTAHPDNLFTLLGGTYRPNVHEASETMCPRSICPNRTVAGSTGGWRGLVSSTAELWQQFASPSRREVNFIFDEDAATRNSLASGRAFVASLRPARGPVLDYLHVELPHQPFHLLPTWQDYVETKLPGTEVLVWPDATTAETGHQRHLLQAQAADKLLGRILTRLKRIGAFDDSAIIVTADHGIAFGEDEVLRSVDGANNDEIMWTPLFVKRPGQRTAVVDDRPMQSVDVLPTVGDILDVRIPWRVDGRSAEAAGERSDVRRHYPRADFVLIPPQSTMPPDGRDHLEVEGAPWFSRLLTTRAAPPGPDPALRVYQRPEFGELVGRRAADVTGVAARGGVVFKLNHPEHYDNVQPDADRVPWAYADGVVTGLPGGTPIAIAVDGTIAAVTRAVRLPDSAAAIYTAVLSPQAVRPGQNVVTMYAIGGTAEAPTLEPIPQLWYT